MKVSLSLPLLISVVTVSSSFASSTKTLADIGAGKTLDLNINANDTPDTLIELGQTISGACLTESTLQSLSSEMLKVYQDTSITKDESDHSDINEELSQSGTRTSSTQLLFGGHRFSAYYPNPTKADEEYWVVLDSRIASAQRSIDFESPATVTAGFDSSELGVDETFEFETVMPAILIKSETEEVCTTNNFGRETCKNVPVGATTAQLVIGTKFSDSATWNNRRTGKPTKKTIDLKAYASCVFWKWADARQ